MTETKTEKDYTQKGVIGEIVDFPNKKRELEAFEKYATDTTKEAWAKIQKEFPEVSERIEIIAGEQGSNGKPYAIIKAVAPFTVEKEGGSKRNLLVEMTGQTLTRALEKGMFNAKDAAEKSESYVKGPFKKIPAKEGEKRKNTASIVIAKFVETPEERQQFLAKQKELRDAEKAATPETKEAPKAEKAPAKRTRTTKKAETTKTSKTAAKEAQELF